jgi:hypothetical protein
MVAGISSHTALGAVSDPRALGGQIIEEGPLTTPENICLGFTSTPGSVRRPPAFLEAWHWSSGRRSIFLDIGSKCLQCRVVDILGYRGDEIKLIFNRLRTRYPPKQRNPINKTVNATIILLIPYSSSL